MKKMRFLAGMLRTGCASLILILCPGCFSGMTWTETGKIITHVEDVKADFSKPKELTVHSTGWQEKNYLPFDWSAVGHTPWEKHITLPLDRLPDREIGFPNENEITVGTHMKKFRFHKTESGLWSMAEHQHGYVHPDDIPHLSEPYIRYAIWDRWLMIPLEVRETSEEQGKYRTIHVKSYWAHTVRFPGDRDVQDMEGVGITIWRCCLLPIPIVLDAATLPIQLFIWIGFLYKGPCSGGLLTD